MNSSKFKSPYQAHQGPIVAPAHPVAKIKFIHDAIQNEDETRFLAGIISLDTGSLPGSLGHYMQGEEFCSLALEHKHLMLAFIKHAAGNSFIFEDYAKNMLGYGMVEGLTRILPFFLRQAWGETSQHKLWGRRELLTRFKGDCLGQACQHDQKNPEQVMEIFRWLQEKRPDNEMGLALMAYKAILDTERAMNIMERAGFSLEEWRQNTLNLFARYIPLVSKNPEAYRSIQDYLAANPAGWYSHRGPFGEEAELRIVQILEQEKLQETIRNTGQSMGRAGPKII